MDTTYNLIKKIENDSLFIILLKKGLIPLSILDRKCYYERYLLERNTNGKLQSITNTADEYNVSERTIYNAIKLMEN